MRFLENVSINITCLKLSCWYCNVPIRFDIHSPKYIWPCWLNPLGGSWSRMADPKDEHIWRSAYDSQVQVPSSETRSPQALAGKLHPSSCEMFNWSSTIVTTSITFCTFQLWSFECPKLWLASKSWNTSKPIAPQCFASAPRTAHHPRRCHWWPWFETCDMLPCQLNMVADVWSCHRHSFRSNPFWAAK